MSNQYTSLDDDATGSVPKLHISTVGLSNSHDQRGTPRTARAAVDRAIEERELAAEEAAYASADAHHAQQTARAVAVAARESAEAASRRLLALSAESSEYERAKQVATASSEAALAAKAASDKANKQAQATERKAAIQAAVVAASAGRYIVVSSRSVEAFDSEHTAAAVAAGLWSPWVLYHEQRGSYTEISQGGVALPFAHTAIRRRVNQLNGHNVNQLYGATPTVS